MLAMCNPFKAHSERESVDWQARLGFAGRFTKVAQPEADEPARAHHLHNGPHSKVIHVRERATGDEYVVKKLRPDGYQGVSKALRAQHEFDIGQRVRSPYAVVAKEMWVDRRADKAMLVIPFVDGPTLRTTTPLSEPQIKQVFADVLMALRVAHTQGIAHGDIKGRNMMVAHARGRIIDWGLAQARAPSQAQRRDIMNLAGTMMRHWPVPQSDDATAFFHWLQRQMMVADMFFGAQDILDHPFFALECQRPPPVPVT